MTKDGKMELMAPAGNFESLQAALDNGADSVYFGVEQLNMRARASINFTMDDLPEIVKRCEEKGVRSYLTLNTIIYDHDLSLIKNLLDRAKEANITAVIAMDQSVIAYARQIGIEIHISTQINVTNIETVKFYAMFADTMVLSRELSLKQVKKICEQIIKDDVRGPSGNLVEIEIFGHGALCMAVSGKCYLSLHEKNLSANRGECNQICRRGYTVKDKDSEIELEIDNEYIMSPKDLKTIHFMNKMMDAGVRVFKIEGRARGPEYVRTVTSCYKEAIVAYCNGTYTDEKIEAWDERLRSVFNRGFWDGYYLGQRLGEWSSKYGSGSTKRKVYVAKGIKYFSSLGVAEFEMESGSLKVGDEILITGPTTGAVMQTIDEIRVELNPVQETVKGERFSFKVGEKVRPSDRLYKMVPVEQKKELK